jgi:hypothetical protein
MFCDHGGTTNKNGKTFMAEELILFFKKERIKSGRNFEMAMFVCVALECGWNVGERAAKGGGWCNTSTAGCNTTAPRETRAERLILGKTN